MKSTYHIARVYKGSMIFFAGIALGVEIASTDINHALTFATADTAEKMRDEMNDEMKLTGTDKWFTVQIAEDA